MLASPDALTTLDRLADAFGDTGRGTENARYEVFLRSTGDGGALVDAAPREVFPFTRAVARLGNERQGPVLRAVLAGVPARRRVLKVGTDGALSLFQAVDVPAAALPRLAEPFGRRAAAERIQDAFEGAVPHVCGWAVDVPLWGQPVRVRFYAMAPATEGEAAVVLLARRLGLDAAIGEAIRTCWNRFAADRDVVVNLQAAEPFSVKLEFPGVPVAEAVTGSAAGGWSGAVRCAAERLRCTTLTHLGVRWTAGHSEEVCAYLSAVPRCPVGDRSGTAAWVEKE